MKAVRHPEFRCYGKAPLSHRPSAWKAWGEVLQTALYAAFALAAVMWLAWYSGLAWSQETCWAWGGSNSASQGQFVKCPPQAPVVVQVPGPVQVREVKVPTPVVVPAPAPQAAPAPAPKIRN